MAAVCELSLLGRIMVWLILSVEQHNGYVMMAKLLLWLEPIADRLAASP